MELSPTAASGLAPRGRFISEVREACEGGHGYAAGKVIVSERTWLAHPGVLAQERDPGKRRAYELALRYRSLKASGVFPATPEFIRHWSSFFARQVAELDSIGVQQARAAETLFLLRAHGIDGSRAIDYKDQQPDRSSPDAPERCYLPFMEGLDLLLICPFAEFLAERATRTTFEQVWAKTGKAWFHPRSVHGLELPYGYSSVTQSRYGNALELLDSVQRQVAERRFDVALIAAGGLGIPLAAFIKQQDRVAISLGGHLQVLFGVLGERWSAKQSWNARYFNESWVHLPARYVPGQGESSEDYW